MQKVLKLAMLHSDITVKELKTTADVIKAALQVSKTRSKVKRSASERLIDVPDQIKTALE